MTPGKKPASAMPRRKRQRRTGAACGRRAWPWRGAPGDHDAGEPAARSEAVEQKVRGDLAGGVAEEEEARAEAVDGGAEVQVAVHLEGGEADVDAIHVGGAVAEGDEGNEAQGSFAHGGAADGCVCGEGLRQ